MTRLRDIKRLKASQTSSYIVSGTVIDAQGVPYSTVILSDSFTQLVLIPRYDVKVQESDS